MKKDPVAASFRDLEWDCELKFRKYRHIWHLYTDGRNADIIFRDQEDMKVGMNLIGISLLKFPDLKMFTFELMNNHLHIILSGERCRCEEFFSTFKARLWKFFSRNGRIVNMHDFNCGLAEITTLQSLRNEIVYVNRNGYVVHPECTPFSYPWGAGACFFNPFMRELQSVSYRNLTVREKRGICHSNDICLPGDNIKVYKGVILPSSYCAVTEAESFFRNAHQYFHYLSKRYEAYGEIAGRLHETVFIADEEMYAAVCMLCQQIHGVKHPGLLNAKDRIEMARRMHQDYNASNRQIRSILKLDKQLVEQLFPTTA